MELLLAYINTHSRCFSQPFLRQLFHVMVSTEVFLSHALHFQSQLVRLYAQRIFRCIYDKGDASEDRANAPRRQIILMLVDMLELFQERFFSPHWFTRSLHQIETHQLQQEAEVVVASSSEGGPLFFLLVLIHSLFLSQRAGSKAMQEPLSQDFFLLVSHLLSTFGAISDEHPDFLSPSFLSLTFQKNEGYYSRTRTAQFRRGLVYRSAVDSTADAQLKQSNHLSYHHPHDSYSITSTLCFFSRRVGMLLLLR